MKKLIPFLLTLLFLCGCSHSAMRDDPSAPNASGNPGTAKSSTASFQPAESARPTGNDMETEPFSPEPTAEEPTTEDSTSDLSDHEERTMQVKINDTPVSVQWEDNESVAALTALVREGPLTVAMSPYGGFEQVGPVGKSLPRNDVQTVTEPGDLVLYSGNQLVVFYGSNTWAYTRLGHITDKTPWEMTELLGGGAVTITISMEVAKK